MICAGGLEQGWVAGQEEVTCGSACKLDPRGRSDPGGGVMRRGSSLSTTQPRCGCDIAAAAASQLQQLASGMTATSRTFHRKCDLPRQLAPPPPGGQGRSRHRQAGEAEGSRQERRNARAHAGARQGRGRLGSDSAAAPTRNSAKCVFDMVWTVLGPHWIVMLLTGNSKRTPRRMGRRRAATCPASRPHHAQFRPHVEKSALLRPAPYGARWHAVDSISADRRDWAPQDVVCDVGLRVCHAIIRIIDGPPTADGQPPTAQQAIGHRRRFLRCFGRRSGAARAPPMRRSGAARAHLVRRLGAAKAPLLCGTRAACGPLPPPTTARAPLLQARRSDSRWPSRCGMQWKGARRRAQGAMQGDRALHSHLGSGSQLSASHRENRSVGRLCKAVARASSQLSMLVPGMDLRG